MPLLGDVEPPAEIFDLPVSVDLLLRWLQQHVYGIMGGLADVRNNQLTVLKQITIKQTEYGSLLVNVAASGISYYYHSKTGALQSRFEDWPYYMSFLLIKAGTERTELWARYWGLEASDHYYIVIRDLLDWWPQSKKHSRAELQWPDLAGGGQKIPEPPVYLATHDNEHKRQTKRPSRRSAGRPRNDVDEWARQQIWWEHEPPDQVFTEWRRTISPKRLKDLADPRDSFNKLMRTPPKGGNPVQKSDEKDQTG